MPRIVKSIDIDVPREHVFAHAVDVGKYPEWISFIKQMEITSGDGKSRGTTDRSLIKIGPRAQPVEAEWTEYEPSEAFGRRATSGMQMQGRMTFTPSGEGTRLEWTIEYTAPMGTLGAVIDVLFMNRVFQNEIEESLENLKAVLES